MPRTEGPSRSVPSPIETRPVLVIHHRPRLGGNQPEPCRARPIGEIVDRPEQQTIPVIHLLLVYTTTVGHEVVKAGRFESGVLISRGCPEFRGTSVAAR